MRDLVRPECNAHEACGLRLGACRGAGCCRDIVLAALRRAMLLSTYTCMLAIWMPQHEKPFETAVTSVPPHHLVIEPSKPQQHQSTEAKASGQPSSAIYVITVGFSRPVNSFNFDTFSAVWMIGPSASCASLP